VFSVNPTGSVPDCPRATRCARSRRLMHLVKNSTRLLEKQLARRTDLHAATKAIEELETDLPFQILNLSRQRRLRHPQA
jgi:hypothetical protein